MGCIHAIIFQTLSTACRMSYAKYENITYTFDATNSDKLMAGGVK